MGFHAADRSRCGVWLSNWSAVRRKWNGARIPPANLLQRCSPTYGLGLIWYRAAVGVLGKGIGLSTTN